jgi:hypothetical protein
VRASGGNGIDEQILEWLQRAIEQRLRFDPRAAGAAVPELRLLVTSTLYCLHDSSPVACLSNRAIALCHFKLT